MKNCIKASFPYNDKFILVRIILADSPLSKCLVCNAKKVLYSRIFKHSCGRAKIEVLVGVLHFDMNDCPVLL